MKVSILQMFLMFWITIFSLNAQTNERYIEVTGTSEVEIIPDKIHYIIEIQEYFEEEGVDVDGMTPEDLEIAKVFLRHRDG